MKSKKATLDKIRNAIESHQKIKIHYANQSAARIVHPYYVGIHNGILTLHAYQSSGFSESGDSTNWKNLNIDKISQIESTSQKFYPPDNNEYNPNASENFYLNILFQIKLNPSQKLK